MRKIFRYAVARIAARTVLMIAHGVRPIVLVAEPLTALHRRGLFLPNLGKEAYAPAFSSA
ncbi:MAG TPA: hypothetical protein VNA69_20255 [Thermoanaerobaculia bacterium]|nr:hypothetical protein [Thermoanaerobaculia bacterium]